MYEFSLTIKWYVSSVLKKTSNNIISKGGSFSWNEQNGYFSWSWVEWSYIIKNNKIYISLSKKPLFISWNYIETQIKSFFQN